MPLLDDIITGAVTEHTPLPTLLRQCLVLAHQLKNEKLKAWVEQELNGYKDAEALPDYRVVGAAATGSFAGPFGNVLNNQPLASSILKEDFRHWAEKVFLTQPIAAYDVGKDEDGSPNGGRIAWPQDLVNMYSDKFIKGWSLIRASQQIPGTVFTAILDTVRTRILQLALELKDELGDDTSDILGLPEAKVDQSVVNHIYGGNVVVAASAQQFSQLQSMTVTQNDLSGLLSAMKELGLVEQDVKKLEIAVKDDAKTGSKTVGQRTAEWLKDIPVALGNGTLKVGFDAARALATKFVLGYFGLGGS
ncbi:hypothetical protein EDE08_104421 [Bradyrhizobium sp. R2.2-H]|jgi:hypothetical protein|uniref:AbiTii domain-containing protein n=1 Tax=unclassified Bradyrhizobium TaxID=2631580 RepID=UPI001050B8AD|nr:MULTISPECIES: hypothetical protein [unclassified Bradyrhizobium]TCU73555.1 hypothetical protein EDE10_104221 [Bradyrhizobium sp. Y-H1]TCU76255.1 hypothetical protein EDE08_104421 [Bradyrhizobium sp. R2.2-H]